VKSENSMKTKKIEFENREGYKLSARFDEPDSGKIVQSVLFAHCFTCGKNLKAAGNISRALTEKNIAVFRFDFTGLGESEGDFADSTFSSDVSDLVSAAEKMNELTYPPGILIGHSLGGTAVLQAAKDIPSSKAVITIGSPCSPEHVTHHFDHKIDEIQSKGEATVQLAGRPFKVKKKFIDDLKEQQMNETIRGLGKALMIFHSPVDRTVDISNAAHIYKLARHPKSFISLDDADHLLTSEKDSNYVGEVTAAWAGRYFCKK
jgi:esterase/lipase